MVGRTKSKRKKHRQDSELQKTWMLKVIEFYQADQKDPAPEKLPRSARQCCSEAEDLCFQEDKKKIKLSYVTLLRRANGGRSIHEFNATKRWLTDAGSEGAVV
jgi:hypothetical protein